MSDYFEHTTVAGERWDLIAWKYYRDANLQSEVIRANRRLFRDAEGRIGPIPRTLKGGMTIKVPVIVRSIDETDLPPWKRNQPKAGAS